MGNACHRGGGVSPKRPFTARRRPPRLRVPASVKAAEKATKRQRSRTDRLAARPEVPAWFHRYLRVQTELLEEAAPVTFQAIAKRMGIDRVSLWRLRRRHPGCDAWVSQQLAEETAHLVGPVLRKMAMLALRGSVQHAELFLKYMAAAHGLDGHEAGAVHVHTGPAIINIAVPRPGDPPVSSSQQQLGDATRTPAADSPA